MAKTKLLKNKKMNSEVFELRKQVMKIIYEVKQVVGNLPRITVRITENKDNIMGLARMGQNMIWIPERMFTGESKRYLREIVYHEICHAVWGIEHRALCPLMRPSIGSRPLTKEQCDIIIRRYAQGQ